MLDALSATYQVFRGTTTVSQGCATMLQHLPGQTSDGHVPPDAQQLHSWQLCAAAATEALRLCTGM